MPMNDLAGGEAVMKKHAGTSPMSQAQKLRVNWYGCWGVSGFEVGVGRGKRRLQKVDGPTLAYV